MMLQIKAELKKTKEKRKKKTNNLEATVAMLLEEATYPPRKRPLVLKYALNVDSKEDDEIVSELTSREVMDSHKFVLEVTQWKCSQIFILAEEF